MSACISYPVEKDNNYELLHNYSNIENENIINSNISYTGAEIKFWFIYNRIDFSNYNNRGFLKYLESGNRKCITDNKFYFVIYDSLLGINKIVLDKSK